MNPLYGRIELRTARRHGRVQLQLHRDPLNLGAQHRRLVAGARPHATRTFRRSLSVNGTFNHVPPTNPQRRRAPNIWSSITLRVTSSSSVSQRLAGTEISRLMSVLRGMGGASTYEDSTEKVIPRWRTPSCAGACNGSSRITEANRTFRRR